MAGQASIWSLRRRVASDTQPDERDGAMSLRYYELTIELDRQCRAVQVRGFANRSPHTGERKILERWAKARGIVLP